jgi:hypothetical protein
MVDAARTLQYFCCLRRSSVVVMQLLEVDLHLFARSMAVRDVVCDIEILFHFVTDFRSCKSCVVDCCSFSQQTSRVRPWSYVES